MINMKVKLIPGPRDEEKISAVLNARKSLSEDDWVEFVGDCCGRDDREAWFDAFYYAGGNGDAAIAEQAFYFYEQLIYEEYSYFADRLAGYTDYDWKNGKEPALR